MPSTIYKGDLAEVSFAPEVGLPIRIGTDANSDVGLSIATTAGNGFTLLTFKAEVNTTLFEAGVSKLKFPKNMLVGSQLVFTAAGGTGADDIVVGDLGSAGNNGRVFTIVENEGTTMKISPEMLTDDIVTVGAGNVMEILPYKTPPMDVGMQAGANNESVKTDQFLGIASAITLPETIVDLKRYHVVGLGRDVSVQVPGKFTNEGGSFEVAMHTARWLKYCLGHELINSPDGGSVATTLSAATEAGQSFITVASKSVGSGIAVNDYVEIRDDAPIVPIVSDHEPDADGVTAWGGTLTDFLFDNAKPHEVRRVIGISENDNRLYLDEPLAYPHASGTDVEVRDPGTPGSNPVTVSSTGTITHPVTHLLYSRSTVPSFSLEVSQRRRDMDTEDSSVDGGANDSKELARVYRGCKVKDFTLSTDNDAALRLAVNFDAALCYTDTGRLEGSSTFTDATCDYNNDPTITMDSTALITVGMPVSGSGIPAGATVASITSATEFELSVATTGGAVTNGTLTFSKGPITRFASHRMFDDTANTEQKRIESGIAKGTQKPFMFYHGSVTVAGQQIAQINSQP